MKKINAFCSLILFSAIHLTAQTYSDGPIELQVRVTAVRVDYDTFNNVSNDYDLGSTIMAGVPQITVPSQGLADDEMTYKVWARDNSDIDGMGWQGGDCITADLPMSSGGPEIYTPAIPVIIFSHAYTSAVVPQFFDLKLEAWEDDISTDFDLLPAGIPFVLSNDCQTVDGFNRCLYESNNLGCINIFGISTLEEADDIYCDADPFKTNLDYRAAGPPGQWNNHGFIAGNCPANNFYQVEIESYWRYTNTTTDPVSGRIISESGSPVPSASLKADGTGTPQTVTTGANGDYTLLLDSGRSYDVKPSKSNDVYINNGITSIDALLMRRHILGMPLSSPYKIIAADVNSNGGVSTADVLLVRSMILQTISIFPGNRLWSFAAHDFVFADPTNPFPYDSMRHYPNVVPLSGQDFIGMKLGDVNNSWDPNVAKREPYAGKVVLELPEMETRQGGEVVLPLIAKQFNDVSGLQFTIGWNPDGMKLLEVENGSIEIDYNRHRTDEGKLSVLWMEENAASLTLKEGDELFKLRFSVTNASASFEVNSDITPIEAVNGNLELLEVESVKKEITTQLDNLGYEVRNFPNPFQDATILDFTLPNDSEVQLQIFNVVGKQLREHTGFFDAGTHQFIIDRDEMPSGSYFVKFRVGGFEKNFKIICY